MYVAGQDQQIDLEAGEDPLRLCHEIGEHIEVRVADMQNAIAVERRRQPGHCDLHLDAANVERIAPSPAMEAGEPQAEPDGGENSLPMIALRHRGRRPTGPTHWRPRSMARRRAAHPDLRVIKAYSA